MNIEQLKEDTLLYASIARNCFKIHLLLTASKINIARRSVSVVLMVPKYDVADKRRFMFW